MTTSSGDAGSTPVEPGTSQSGTSEPGTSESPYGIGVADDDAAVTGPKPLDTDLEDEQVQGER